MLTTSMMILVMLVLNHRDASLHHLGRMVECWRHHADAAAEIDTAAVHDATTKTMMM
jgi:hypothetical protein